MLMQKDSGLIWPLILLGQHYILAMSNQVDRWETTMLNLKGTGCYLFGSCAQYSLVYWLAIMAS